MKPFGVESEGLFLWAVVVEGLLRGRGHGGYRKPGRLSSPASVHCGALPAVSTAFVRYSGFVKPPVFAEPGKA